MFGFRRAGGDPLRQQRNVNHRREEIHPSVSWLVLIVMVLSSVFVYIGQMSVMSTSFMSIFGWYPAVESSAAEYASNYRYGEIGRTLLFSLGVLTILFSGGYKRIQNIMTGFSFPCALPFSWWPCGVFKSCLQFSQGLCHGFQRT